MLFAALLMLTNGNQSVTVVERLDTSKINTHYVGNRAPLKPSAFIKLPVGAVKPKGWLLETLRRQHAGLAGQLGEISVWLQKEGNAWLSEDGKGEWGWEELPYWLKGYTSTAFILEDDKAIAEAKAWIDGAIASQRPNGDFGPAMGEGPTRDYWGNMVMLYCLQTYYEATEDKRVIDLMTKYFRFQLSVPDDEFLNGYWQRVRGGDNLHSVMWLYNITGDAFLIDLMHKVHRCTTDWTSPRHRFEDIRNAKSKRSGMDWPDWFLDLPDWHNVNVAQAFREPAQYWQLSGEKLHLEAAYRNHRVIRERFGQVPGGMFGGDENSRPGYDDPRQAIETCGIVEQMNSDQHMLRITGDPMWADHCEDVAFNTLPAAFMSDMKSLRYLTAPNMAVSDSESHHPGIDNGGPFLVMNPFSNRCCQHNHTQGWPYFVENLWMATPDNGLAAVMYSPSEVTAKVGSGETVTIRTDTKYPFEETVNFAIAEGGGRFPIYLRIPSWCETASVSFPGGSNWAWHSSGKLIRLEFDWEEGDTFTLSLEMKVKTRTWEDNHDSVSVDYGPLTFSLKIDEKYTRVASGETAVHDARWQKGADPSEWPSWEINPTSAWNYALTSMDFDLRNLAWPKDGFPWTAKGVPLQLIAKARRVPEWTLDETGLVAELQDSPAKTSEPEETITLIPMGAARLRISAFPTASPTGTLWTTHKAPVRLYQARASHTWGGDSVHAVCDGVEPQSSNDQGVPRHTFWPHKGTEEWITATFDTPREIRETSVYWFDDTGDGECRVPESWSVEWLDGEVWRPVRPLGEWGVARDTYNRVPFEPVVTTALRMRLKLQEGFSAGVLEWRVPERRH